MDVVGIAFSSKDYGSDAVEGLAPTMRSMGHNESHANGGGQLAVAFQPGNLTRQAGASPSEDVFPMLKSDHGRGLSDQMPHVALGVRDVAPTLTRNYGKQPDSSDTNSGPMVLPTQGMQVRRRTPTECERLQGFPDGHTRIPWRGKGADECPDGPRYKALGNSMAVPVMRWIGRRLATAMKNSLHIA